MNINGDFSNNTKSSPKFEDKKNLVASHSVMKMLQDFQLHHFYYRINSIVAKAQRKSSLLSNACTCGAKRTLKIGLGL